LTPLPITRAARIDLPTLRHSTPEAVAEALPPISDIAELWNGGPEGRALALKIADANRESRK